MTNCVEYTVVVGDDGAVLMIEQDEPLIDMREEEDGL